MMIGTFKHTIDDKGRIAVPVRFRADLGERFIVSRGDSGCLYLHPYEVYNKMASELRAKGKKRDGSIHRVRAFLAASSIVDIDAQGRVCIPPELRDYADLKGASIVVGGYDRAEIWNLENWQKEMSLYDDEDDDVLDLLDPPED